MAGAVVDHMKKQSVKSVGFLGYIDAYGEQWFVALDSLLKKAEIKMLGVERLGCSDISVTAQALKLSSIILGATVLVSSGIGADMPQLGLIERGYMGKRYQMHAAAKRGPIRLGG